MASNINKMVEDNPLILFSLYSCEQAQRLERVAKELEKITSKWEAGSCINDFTKAYDLFYLWVLGAYEWSRTLNEHKKCFSMEFQDKLGTLLTTLTILRVPFAKQQLSGGKKNKEPIYAENSVTGIKNGLVFNIRGKSYNSRDVTNQFLEFLHSIGQEDISHNIPTNTKAN